MLFRSVITERGAIPAQFTTLVNAISVNIPDDVSEEEARLTLSQLPHVAGVFRERQYRPRLFGTIPQIRAKEAWEVVGAGGSAAAAGAGVRIAIVDAGITSAHAMFSGAGMSFPSDIPSPGRGETTNTNA